MSEVLTFDEYQAIASSLDYPTNAFIDGRFQSAKSGKTFDTINPATGETLAKLAACNGDDIDLAVSKAREAFDQGCWSKLHPADRKQTLIRLAKLIKRNQHELAVLESLDSGKPVSDCATVDIPETIQCLIWHAEAIDKIYDQTAPTGDDAIAMIVREPVGVVGCVLPWNFPLLMLAWKIAPALAAGNSVIVKPAEQTSLTALRIAELAMDAGLPRGVLNVITGLGPDVGEPLGLHPDVDMISFTGSTKTGRRFLHYSADSNLKKIVLECGGKNPAIVLDDAEDLDLVAQHIVNGAFWNMGENCSASSRLIVQQGIKKELLEKMMAHLRDWKTGDPLNPRNQLGALIDRNHFDKVCSYLDADHILIGGAETGVDGLYVLPTIIDQVSTDSKHAQEEIFGPVLSVITVKTLDEAIAVANNSEYGLTASVFSANGKKAIRAARAIRAGTVTINCYGEGDISTPFGGYKQSGFGGRDNSLHAHDQYTEIKTIWIDLSDRAAEEAVD
ncbi:MAG: aldehyde dehydrogenase [Gammaproteobacteria bacterium]|jgi:gamma-glutamyl-gamma-aminobutyraldehyde dehydrogenase|nr:aldehyde dehydrogenase [Gammaproteobacteria bacterium]MBT3724514.1 aldehyde dehydrogenase [Gammaproteobacteria bacterium]MBT4194465.1 aldehyde dehydrogenase [Gammaproteobacteria bacterium]MBT4451147.1 aldehyde dehydrogenase [Gammaproteobacteria bacterium]MBT4863312.1 aldehyde dehydrogenase [Gammaproteobacteria bacterium]